MQGYAVGFCSYVKNTRKDVHTRLPSCLHLMARCSNCTVGICCAKLGDVSYIGNNTSVGLNTVHSVHYETLKLGSRQQMHNYTIYAFFLLLISYMFRHCCHPQGTYTKISLKHNVRVIKSRRMRWVGHVARMGEGRGVYRVLVGKPEGKRPLGRPRRRWEDNIRMDLQEVGLGYEDWIGLAQDRERWLALVSAVRNLRVP